MTSWKAHKGIYYICGNDFDWKMFIFEFLLYFLSRRVFPWTSSFVTCWQSIENEIKYVNLKISNIH